MIITKEWIMAHQTARGSWNAKQLKCLGITWPPPKGWHRRAVGTEVSALMANRFEHFAGEPVKDKTIELQQKIIGLNKKIVRLEAAIELLLK